MDICFMNAIIKKIPWFIEEFCMDYQTVQI